MWAKSNKWPLEGWETWELHLGRESFEEPYPPLLESLEAAFVNTFVQFLKYSLYRLYIVYIARGKVTQAAKAGINWASGSHHLFFAFGGSAEKTNPGAEYLKGAWHRVLSEHVGNSLIWYGIWKHCKFEYIPRIPKFSIVCMAWSKGNTLSTAVLGMEALFFLSRFFWKDSNSELLSVGWRPILAITIGYSSDEPCFLRFVWCRHVTSWAVVSWKSWCAPASTGGCLCGTPLAISLPRWVARLTSWSTGAMELRGLCTCWDLPTW